jgi:hypothetical protein
MPEPTKMLLNKAKLIAALKVRRAAIVKNHAKRIKGFAKEIAAYRKESLACLKEIERQIKLARTCREIRQIGDDVCVASRDYPRPPHKFAATSAIDKILAELNLLDETVVTVESSRNYLDILRGDEDGTTKEYDDDEDDAE